jgi:hypothetical protein
VKSILYQQQAGIIYKSSYQKSKKNKARSVAFFAAYTPQKKLCPKEENYKRKCIDFPLLAKERVRVRSTPN